MLIYNQMVVDSHVGEQAADRIFRALADPTRRDIIRRSAGGEHSVSALARFYPISVTAVQKHVAVLEGAGLVERTKRGREQLVQSRPGTIAVARELLEHIEEIWLARMERVGDLIAEPSEEETEQ